MGKQNKSANRKRVFVCVVFALTAVFLIISPGCGLREVKKEKEFKEVDKLTAFFETCELDIVKAVKVIISEDIIKNLSHLLRMDAGGRKYYLLERENLSEMIRAVTVGTYTDLILINRTGTIIYTMYNDNIFGKNVTRSLVGSPLYNCFIKGRENNLHVEDVSIFPPVTGSLNIFVSLLNERDEFSRGLFVMQIDTGIIRKLLGRDITVIDETGRYRIHGEGEQFLNQCPYFNMINLDELEANRRTNFMYNEKEYSSSAFRFADLRWIIITPQSIL